MCTCSYVRHMGAAAGVVTVGAVMMWAHGRGCRHGYCCRDGYILPRARLLPMQQVGADALLGMGGHAGAAAANNNVDRTLCTGRFLAQCCVTLTHARCCVNTGNGQSIYSGACTLCLFKGSLLQLRTRCNSPRGSHDINDT
ncbi:hypothetical protein VOLCADRAFT_104536 [Volvox carteri f. nagariensis]|uniref:Uncharacterized protein n=1 Tax=Volvox carteri f. nagariensis TaxID=3068 RepID=D8TU98_VOLCA|nr:uncharacterized protein VOLCADRAFT_104536 [Volvox carteri f. nagariensis]EFJ49106.1 hypothetical protein VOLCADRAFT_104536 [Volvox carteri f. nagariensis]|eukprot:XP_002950003.1 hypothetical protein VOLCADRAFT_104536 [Volvox carteri f. nagariensis]